MSAVSFGILAMFGWGIDGFTAKKSVDEFGEHKAYLFIQGIGVLLSFIIGIIYSGLSLRNITPFILIATLLIGLTYAIAYINAFTAYRIGKLAIVSPILCSYGMLSSVLAAIFLHQSLSSLQLAGIIVIITGTLLLSFDLEELKKSKFTLNDGVKEAIITFIFFGINSVILDYTVNNDNVYIVNLLNSAISLLFIVLFFLVKKMSLALPRESSKIGIGLLITTAILTALANLWFILGYNIGDSILIAPLGASSGAITAILSFIILKEKVTPLQLTGIIGTFVGIVWISL